jgi:penicillin-binding protein 1A
VARTFFLNRSRSLGRKFKEALLALKIESQLSKDQVLELYMNQIYLGRAPTASRPRPRPISARRWRRSRRPSAPCWPACRRTRFVNPIRNYERARARQLVALARMRSQGVIDEAQYQQAKAQKLQIRRLNEVDVHAEYVAEMARQQVYAQFGELSYSTGLKVETTLRADEQEAAYKALRRSLIERELRQPGAAPRARVLAPVWPTATRPWPRACPTTTMTTSCAWPS